MFFVSSGLRELDSAVSCNLSNTEVRSSWSFWRFSTPQTAKWSAKLTNGSVNCLDISSSLNIKGLCIICSCIGVIARPVQKREPPDQSQLHSVSAAVMGKVTMETKFSPFLPHLQSDKQLTKGLEFHRSVAEIMTYLSQRDIFSNLKIISFIVWLSIFSLFTLHPPSLTARHSKIEAGNVSLQACMHLSFF